MPSRAQSFVATLIAPDGAAELPRAVAEIAALLPDVGAPDWLEPGRAADIPFASEAERLPEIRARVAERCLALGPVDAVVQATEGRRKKLLLADMDSTMIGQECIDELADFAGMKPQVASITERAMRGELAFEPALRERVALLEGLPLTVVDEVIATRLTLTPGGSTLVRTMRAHGAYTCLVSGGFTLFTGPVASRIGFDENRGNTLLAEAGRLLGRVAEPILGQAAKLATLRELRERLGLSAAETLAIGDGANDLAMIGEAGLGVAYHAKPAVAAAAAARIDKTDLTSLLYAQGYRRSSFVEA